MTEALVCMACGADIAPEIGECFDCPAPSFATPRRGVRYRVTRVSGDPRVLAWALAAIVPTSLEHARWLVARPMFDVVVRGTEAQHAAFVGLIAGSTFNAIDEAAPACPEAFRWAWQPKAKWKLGATAAFTVAAAVVGSPTVLWGSLAMAGYLAWRGFSYEPCSVTAKPEALDAQLDPLEPSLKAAYRAARASLSAGEQRQGLDRCMAAIARARADTRRNGEHLRDPAVWRLDAQLGRVANEVVSSLGVSRAARVEAGAAGKGAASPVSANALALFGATERRIYEAMQVTGGAAERAAMLERRV